MCHPGPEKTAMQRPTERDETSFRSSDRMIKHTLLSSPKLHIKNAFALEILKAKSANSTIRPTGRQDVRVQN